MAFHSISEGGYEYIGTESRASIIVGSMIADGFGKKGTLDFLVESFYGWVFVGGKGGSDSLSIHIYILHISHIWESFEEYSLGESRNTEHFIPT